MTEEQLKVVTEFKRILQERNIKTEDNLYRHAEELTKLIRRALYTLNAGVLSYPSVHEIMEEGKKLGVWP